MSRPLSDTKCRKAKPNISKVTGKPAQTRLSDGGGLHLVIKPDGRKSWIFRFRDKVTGKRQDMGLGKYGPHDVSLADARIEAGKARAIVRAFKNPIEERKNELEAARAAKSNLLTFRQCRDKFIEANKAEWKNAKHTAQWTSTLDTYAKPILEKPVADIAQNDILKCLEPIWTTKTETATRVRQRIEKILNYAKSRGYRDGDNPAQWKGHLENILPKPTKLKKVRHRPALDYKRVGWFISELRNKDTLAAKALELQILTATRPIEVYGAMWDEIDLAAKVWTIPGSRMKAGKEHEVPLSDRTVKIIQSLPRVAGSDYLFPGLKKGAHMSTAAGMKLVKEIQTGITAHGFRSTFRDWAADCTRFQREVIEHALAHQLKDGAEKAYHRSTVMPKRKKLMASWADYCNTVQTEQADNVTAIGGAK